MSNIKIETYAELMTDVLEDLYNEGPPIIKVCSAIYSNSYNVASPDYGLYSLIQPDKVLAVSTSSSYNVDQDGRISFLDIPDFIGIETGYAIVAEVWNAADTECYFRIRLEYSEAARLIEGNNDLIRLDLNLTYGINEFNSYRSQVNQLPVVVDNSPVVFPIQFRITFPDYILRTDYHKITDLYFGIKSSTNSILDRHRVYASGEGQGIISTRLGWRGEMNVYNSVDDDTYAPIPEDKLHFKFEWTDTLNALLTIHCVRSDILATKLYFDLYSEFYDSFTGYGPAPLVNTIDPSIFSPRALIVSRKRVNDPDFIPVVVTDSGGGVATFQSRYTSIDSVWTWEMMT